MPDPMTDEAHLEVFRQIIDELKAAADPTRLADLLNLATPSGYWAAVMLHTLATATARVVTAAAPGRAGFAALILGPGADETDPHVATGRVLTAALNGDFDTLTAHVRVIIGSPEVYATVIADLCATYHDAVTKGGDG